MDETAGAEPPTAAVLIDQCRQLQTSVLRFQGAAAAQFTPVNLDSYLKKVTQELRMLEKFSTNDFVQSNNVSSLNEDEARKRHALRSSNLLFIQSIWNMANRCHNVVALSSQRESYKRNAERSGVVDIVANMGLLWIKIVTINERNLLFEMAKKGWNESDDDDSEVFDLPLVKMVKDLALAAQSSKVRYRRPELLIYFPRLEEDKITIPVIKGIIASLRATGATIHCGSGEIVLRDTTLPASSLQGPENLQRMLPRPLPDLTSTLNIDWTVLQALISDLSHLTLDENSMYKDSLKQQLEEERARPLLLSTLYPVLKGRRLITSHLAVQRTWEVINTLGTPSERVRAEICFQENTFNAAEYTPAKLHSEFQKQSTHIVPPELRLPIEVIDSDREVESGNLPSEVNLLHSELNKLNYSVFTLGWSRNVTTVTSNRPLAKKIESIVNHVPGELHGPEMWVVDTTRTLLGKKK